MKPRSQAHREALRRANLGKVMSEESRRRMSEARKGKPRGPMSDATKAKIGAAAKRNGIPRATLEAAWAASRGRKHTAETKAQMSASQRARLSGPGAREAHSAAAAIGWARRRHRSGGSPVS